jgi:uncharacterized protein YqjF (DUF2071 family)
LNATCPNENPPATTPSADARLRLLAVRGDPLLLADWLQAVFIHFEVDATALQSEVPYPLDLWDNHAFVTLVAFTLRGMRPRVGGKLAALLFQPIASHGFLNVRAYVRHRKEPGIYFLAEWMNNPLSARLGPLLFGLPYRLGKLNYDHVPENARLSGTVTGKPGRLAYESDVAPSAPCAPCPAGSLDEFLLERYTAFTFRPTRLPFPTARSAFFRIWHPPWPQVPINLRLLDTTLLTQTWPWFAQAQLVGANLSPGLRNVWMGRPQSLPR